MVLQHTVRAPDDRCIWIIGIIISWGGGWLAEVLTEKPGSGRRHKTHMAYHRIEPMPLQSEARNELCELLRSYL